MKHILGTLSLWAVMTAPTGWSAAISTPHPLHSASQPQIVAQITAMAEEMSARIETCEALSRKVAELRLRQPDPRNTRGTQAWQAELRSAQQRLADCADELARLEARLGDAQTDLAANRQAQRRDMNKLAFERRRAITLLAVIAPPRGVQGKAAALTGPPVTTTDTNKRLLAVPNRDRLRVKDTHGDDARGTDASGTKVVPRVQPDGSIVYRSEDARTLPETAPNTQVFSWTPVDGGAPGDTLSIEGQHLQGLELWLGGFKFQPAIFGEPGGSRMVTKLPQGQHEGTLRIVRPTDDATFELDPDYTVAPAPVIKHFEHAASGYSWRNAYLLSRLSDEIYIRSGERDAQASNRLETTADDWGLNKVTHLNANTVMSDTQGAVLSSDEVVIVVFRGTETKPSSAQMTLGIADWVTDITFVLVPMPAEWGDHVRVHGGFLAALNDIYAQTHTAVLQHLSHGNPPPSGKRIWITGHSLGGALASLAGFRLSKVDGTAVQGVMTYGSPRVGNTFWQKAYNTHFGARAHRWVNHTDPVPMLPVYTPGVIPVLAYRHAGVRTNIYEDGNIVVGAEEDITGLNISGAWIEHAQYTQRIYEDTPPDPYKELMPTP